MQTRATIAWLPIALAAGVAPRAAEHPEDGKCWSPAESVRGYLIERQGKPCSSPSFHYAANGSPEWLTIQGGYTAAAAGASNIGMFDGTVYLSTNGREVRIVGVIRALATLENCSDSMRA
jgi:hypothetical protein